MRVAEIWRYPVKSLAGERLDAVRLDTRGLEGDRLWALVDPDGGIASGKTTRRFRTVHGLLRHRSHLEQFLPVITLADRRSARADDPRVDELIAAIAPAGWSLQSENRVSHFDAGAVHLLSTRTLSTLGEAFGEPVVVQRLRPNLLLDVGDTDSFTEDGWLDRTLRVGSVQLRITGRVERCVMVGHPQAALEPRPTLLKTIGRINGVCAGVYAEVVTPGEVAEDDVARHC